MSKKLLLADDSVVIQKLVGLSFANESIEIVSTDNGDDAVTMAREIQPDVVLADVVMPGKSGYEVCEAIKQDPALAGTPVLLLTGTFEAFDEARATAAGANGQITKPFEAQALVERVNEVITEAAAAPSPPPVRAAKSSPVIEAEAKPAPPAESDGEETVVTSLGSTPASKDLFGANDGKLGGDTSTAAPSLDLTPQLDAEDAPGSDFFGAPGDGAAEELDQAGGTMALGASMDEERDSAGEELDDATVAVLPDEDLPPMAPLAPRSATSSASSDPFERPAVGERPADPLPAARPVDLDAALDAVPTEGEPTILVATDELNASTSPNLGDAAGDEPSGGFEDLTVHVPSADIDQDRATAPSPDVISDTAIPADTTVVADLDAALEEEAPSSRKAPDFGTPPARDPFDLPKTPEPDATVVQGLDDEDPLGLAPSSVTGGSVDFAFDVSEQVAAEPPPADIGEDSFSSLMDISESAILGATEAPIPDDAIDSPTEKPAAVAREAAAETIVAGYDVSSSDLATAPTADEEDEARPAPIPEPEALVEVPELPEAYRPAVATPAESRSAAPITGNTDLFDDLATGSPLDELPTATADPADITFGAGQDLDVDDDLLAPDLESDLEDESEAADPTDALEIEEEDASPLEAEPFTPPAIDADEEPAGDDFAIGAPPATAPDARIADLSPMVEQRIQETLEKVAWEAFSDLSETIVKQVIGRVEQIAWEVIPEMAETLVREEIRKMKGEGD
ncbi:MAG: response regulator [bacterium]|nr:response regulator [bacterium]